MASKTCFHDLRGGMGNCGSLIYEIHYSQHEDGCWTARVRHPYASLLVGKGSRRNVWWMADAENIPHPNFIEDDFTLAYKIKRLAMKLLNELPEPVTPPSIEALITELDKMKQRVQHLEAREAQLKKRRR